MDDSTVNKSTDQLTEKDVYRISKKLFWLIFLAIVSVLIVLVALVIYFGVRQNHPKHTIENSLNVSKNTSFTPLTRISDDLQPLSYHLTITPDLINKTFQG